MRTCTYFSCQSGEVVRDCRTAIHDTSCLVKKNILRTYVVSSIYDFTQSIATIVVFNWFDFQYLKYIATKDNQNIIALV